MSEKKRYLKNLIEMIRLNPIQSGAFVHHQQNILSLALLTLEATEQIPDPAANEARLSAAIERCERFLKERNQGAA
jgi:hypothetical protein